jgi:predicted permease
MIRTMLSMFMKTFQKLVRKPQLLTVCLCFVTVKWQVVTIVTVITVISIIVSASYNASVEYSTNKTEIGLTN